MDISFFRARKPGPELILEDAVVNTIDSLISEEKLPVWVGCSPTIGSGMPDILLASYDPEICAFTNKNTSSVQILAFLRAVNGANFESILTNLFIAPKIIENELISLMNIKAIQEDNDTFYITNRLENILQNILTIEVKVKNWQQAISQANRNKIFSHQSYIALPKKLAGKLSNTLSFADLRLGLLSISDENLVENLIPAQQCQPIIWEYYYRLALLLASRIKGKTHVICSPN